MRYGATSANYADATVSLVRHYGWRSFSLLSSSDLHGQGFAEVMLNNAAGGAEGGGGEGSPLRVSTHAQFTPHGLDPSLFAAEAAYVCYSLLATDLS